MTRSTFYRLMTVFILGVMALTGLVLAYSSVQAAELPAAMYQDDPNNDPQPVNPDDPIVIDPDIEVIPQTGETQAQRDTQTFNWAWLIIAGVAVLLLAVIVGLLAGRRSYPR
jgi:hypothetical protein